MFKQLHYKTPVLAFMLAFAVVGSSHAAQPTAQLPDQAIRIIAPAAPGGILDQTSRLIGNQLAIETGHTVIVENKAGAGGMLGIQSMLRATPDGTTLVMGSLGPNAANYTLQKNISYTANELAPVIYVLSMPDVVVLNPEVPAKTLDELRAYAKTKEGGLSMAVSTSGSSGHLAGELFKSRTGIPAVNIVYKGASPALVDLVAGRVDFMVDNLITALPLIREGKLRALAVTSGQRAQLLPDTPTMIELGYPGFDVNVWLGIFASSKVPTPVLDTLNRALQKTLASPVVTERFAQQGGIAVGGSREQFAKFVDAETQRWATVIKEAKINVE
ncbi:tripartite tricarboxylate transporter substrate binding protein [Alcaligenaceae bacterium]|nr:tripartite tricarboxylate transporter substrate binding protein [Alcaligenaceae bacterium]